MGGLLDDTRICLRGHGPMTRQPGHFMLAGGVFQPRPVNALAALAHPVPPAMQVVPDGRMYVLAVWRCNVCGSVELVDKE